ncbi:sigma 54-interacting transcriptional regulator [Parasphaerochaeta coccoides]|uniref:Sigma 54 interacting domain protein n=1 Tax=Parasphaerochaeta coccoides (strain ATCC BAA-1237 / DSM 17374 / SPN1) TaxID=760011 RepID=F4GJV4_PARC1|nr:sigma 54-interacting transcriptional regulator [Parasphaerochaeta coccoides]AEC01379.1 Sigma 54 interacting domain protein [Parasphaerochaeta coccoides DSM 17374]
MDTVQARMPTQPLGESEVFLEFQEKASRAAMVERSVLIVGERGSGKEIAALRLHYQSPRWEKPVVTVNCAALPPSLIESELFGYEQGAFTGAQKMRKGRFEEADGGTLFLDEIGLIPLEVQEKILRVVEYGTFERVGSSRTHEVDVRIIGATNADLPQLCREGKFKEDLLDRLSFEVLFLPPLREREGDILLLAHFFAAKMALECGREDIPVFSAEVEEALMTYSWPGNVRELKNVVERAVYRIDGKLITSIQFNPFENPFTRKGIGFHDGHTGDESLPASVAGEDEVSHVPVPSDAPTFMPLLASSLKNSENLDLSSFEDVKRDMDVLFLERALEVAGDNQKTAASLLGLTYDQFRGLYRKYRKKGSA